jgi:hypothetical protein
MKRARNLISQSQSASPWERTQGTKVSIQEEFSRFHRAHPEICRALISLARRGRAGVSNDIQCE